MTLYFTGQKEQKTSQNKHGCLQLYGSSYKFSKMVMLIVQPPYKKKFSKNPNHMKRDKII